MANFDLESFDLKNLNDLEVKEKHHIEFSNRFAVPESLYESFENNNALETIIENIETSAKGNLGYQKLQHEEIRYNVECSKLID
jgi:hypothetical protein